ncbi:response regulator transcription factor [Bacillus carboniphilus]|uniref:Response regulator transcription factor n=2 Tax=Bacillati TaxID=1783272 RepID=A0ABP3GE48_9BACI
MKKILIVEDERSIAELEKDYLEIDGFSVTIETHGQSGLERALREDFDLLILDVMLPGVDGFQICKQLRSEKDIPILIVTARKEDIDKIRGLGLGADDYMVKPFSPSELVARVKAHLARYERLVNRSGNSGGDELRVGDLVIDRSSRRVFVEGAETVFTSKEFDLLVFLASNPNRVFSKDDLFERIWGIDSMGDISTVTVHIRKIREKIEKNPSDPEYIETVWGVGYRFKG